MTPTTRCIRCGRHKDDFIHRRQCVYEAAPSAPENGCEHEWQPIWKTKSESVCILCGVYAIIPASTSRASSVVDPRDATIAELQSEVARLQASHDTLLKALTSIRKDAGYIECYYWPIRKEEVDGAIAAAEELRTK